MRLSEIKRLIEDHSFCNQFVGSIRAEWEPYKRNISKIGTSLNVYVSEDVPIVIDLAVCQSLATLYFEKKLDQAELAYIIDALQLSEGVLISDDQVEAILNEMNLSQMEGDFTLERAAAIMSMSR